ncbi:hypothetical protein GCM10027049_03060 [Mucilaginibacter puniceus]
MKHTLLKFYLVSSIIFCLITKAQAQNPELSFDYDAAGNQTTRTWICVNCTTPFVSAPFFAKQLGTVVFQGSTTVNTSEERKLIAYPNPLVETLNLKWQNPKYPIKSVDISTINGTRVYSQTYTTVEEQNQVSVPFSKQIPGMYLVRVTYSDGKQEVVRVVKNGF